MSNAAQRKHDAELAANLRRMAAIVSRRMGKPAMLMKAAADRIEQLSGGLDPKPKSEPQLENQPASTPVN